MIPEPTTGETERLAPFDRIIEALSAGRAHGRAPFAICLLAIGLIAAAAAAIGAVHTMRFGHEVFAMLDGGWRFLNGQRAQVDFSSGHGPVMFVVFGLGLAISRYAVQGIGYVYGLFAILVGLGAWVVCCRRMLPVPAVLSAIAMALLVAAPFPLGYPPNWLGNAMSYNRFGFALVGLVVLELLLAAGDDEGNLWAAVVAGGACILALFLKASFFLVAAMLMALSIPLAHKRRRLGGLAAGAAVVLLPLLAYLRFDFPAIWTDLATVGAARASNLPFSRVRWAMADGLSGFLPLVAAGLFLAFDPWRTAVRNNLVRLFPLLASVAIFVGGALLHSTNAQPAGLPLDTFVALVFFDLALRRGPAPRSARPWQLAVLTLAALGFLPDMSGNASGLVYGLIQRAKPLPASIELFKPAQLAHLVLFEVVDPVEWEVNSNGANYVRYVNDGVDLIQRYSLPTETVMTLDHYNPFPYATLRKPAPGGSVDLAYGSTWSDTSKRPAEFLFGRSNIVMVPKYPAGPSLTEEALVKNYWPWIAAHFSLCAESTRWRLYKKNSQLAGCPEAGGDP